MALSELEIEPYRSQLAKMLEDANYSAQSYFEAAKHAELWGRAIVFLPAVFSAIAGVLIAVGGPRELGAIGAVSGAVAATASLLGSDKRAGSFRDSARQFTRIRHRAGMEYDFALTGDSKSSLEAIVRGLRKEYEEIIQATDPVPGKSFEKASKRISSGVLAYQEKEKETPSGNSQVVKRLVSESNNESDDSK